MPEKCNSSDVQCVTESILFGSLCSFALLMTVTVAIKALCTKCVCVCVCVWCAWRRLYQWYHNCIVIIYECGYIWTNNKNSSWKGKSMRIYLHLYLCIGLIRPPAAVHAMHFMHTHKHTNTNDVHRNESGETVRISPLSNTTQFEQ